MMRTTRPITSLLFAGLCLCGLAQGQERAPHVVFVVGEGEYRSEVTMPALGERLEDTWGWDTTVLFDEELHTGDGNRVAGLEALSEADLVVLYLRFRRWPQENLDALQAYVASGRPLAAFRTTTHAFNYDKEDARAAWNQFGAEVLGAPWIYHYGHGSSTRAEVVDRGDDDDILRGVPGEFWVRSWTYHVRPDHPPAGARVLLNGTPLLPDQEGPIDARTINPIAWTRATESGSRVFMTTMGHPEDFRVEGFRRLIGNGLHWALGRDIPDETLADFPDVTHPDDVEDEIDAPWMRMDYGPFLSTAVGIGGGLPAVPKGLVVRLRTLEGEETDLHAVFDTDLLAWRCIWRGELALRGIVFDGPHGTYPLVEGEVLFRAPPVPGVLSAGAGPEDHSDPRPEPWGPIPAATARWSGLHLDGDDVVFEYAVNEGRTRVFERVWAQSVEGDLVFVREVTSQTDEWSVVEGPHIRTLRGLGAGDASSDEVSSADGALRFSPNSTVLSWLAPPQAVNPELITPPARSVFEVIENARPRWGAALSTRGVVDDPLEAEDRARRVSVPAGSSAKAVSLVASTGDALELVVDGESVETAPAGDCVLLRSPDADAKPLTMVSGEERIGWWPSDSGSGTHELNSFTAQADLRLDGVTWRRGVVGRSLDFDGTAAAWLDDVHLDLFEQDLTVSAWIHTTSDGTIFSVGPREGAWAPDGATLFLREGRLSFDVGWVGVVSGGPDVSDGGWHHVAATWRHDGGKVRLYVDGVPVSEGELQLEGEEGRHSFVPRFGWTNEDFPEVTRFSGYMDGLLLVARAVDDETVLSIAGMTGEELAEATVVHWSGDPQGDAPVLLVEKTDEVSQAMLMLPATAVDATYYTLTRRGPRSTLLAWAEDQGRADVATPPFRIDRLTWPDDNPYHSWMRFGAFDFARSRTGDLTSAWITTWSGDLWRVDGLDEKLADLRWTRVATGLNQPFGLATQESDEGEQVLVLGRDQITRVHDRNGDGEADFLESFSNTNKNSEHFHEPASGLIVEPDGSILYIKAARHAKLALHDHHGAVVRVSPDGLTASVVARGSRAPFGLLRLPDGSLLSSDQEGHWTPANRINLSRPSAASPPFLGNGWAAGDSWGERLRQGGEDARPPWALDARMTPPLCWIHPSVDRSPSAQVHADHPAWGPLEGSLLGLSYGTGEVYLILRDDVVGADGATLAQGGIVKLGIQLPTGLLAGRIHPETGDLYVCGLFGWSSNRTDPGGFYRVRPRADEWTRALNVPHRMRATAKGLELTFLHPLQPESVSARENWSVEAWNYERTADYGSATFDLEGRRDARTRMNVRGAKLSLDGRTVLLELDDFGPAMQLHVEWSVNDASGRPLEHSAHLTVHALHPK